MKKHTLSLVSTLLAVFLAVSGCANGKAEASESPETTTAATAAPTETTTGPAPETTTTAAVEDNSDKHAVWTFEGSSFYREDGTPDEWNMLGFDGAMVRLSSGEYHDSETEPDLFIPDEFIYNGEEVGLGETAFVRAGDTVGGVTIVSAKTSLMPPMDWDTGEGVPKFDEYDGYMPFDSEVKLDGTLELTGTVHYHYDEDYTISSGDMLFIPDSSYKGLPMAVDIGGYASVFAARDFDACGGWDERYYGGGTCVYSDAPAFRVGNLFDDYGDDADMIRLFDGGKEDCIRKVRITLSDISLVWSDQFGTGRCSAKIDSIGGM